MSNEMTRMTHRMEDGVLLVSDFYGAAGPSRGILLLVRSDRARSSYRLLGELLSLQGYSLVVQSVRGRHGSGGVFTPYRNECSDGVATIRQLRESDAFRGHRLVLLGEGYSGQAALSAAVRCPPGHLSGVALADVSDNLLTDGLCSNGVLTGWALSQLLSWCSSGVSHVNLDGYWRWQPGASPLNGEPLLEFWALAMRDTQDDSGIWRQSGCRVVASELASLRELPVLLLAGYSRLSSSGGCHLASRLLALQAKRLEFLLGDWRAPFWLPQPSEDSDGMLQEEASALHRLVSWLGRLSCMEEDGEVPCNSCKVGYFMHEVPSVIYPGQELRHQGRWCSGRGLLSGGANRRLFLHFGRLSEEVPAGLSQTHSCYVSEVTRGLRVVRGIGHDYPASSRVSFGARGGSPNWGPEACVFYGPLLEQPLALRAAMRLHLWCSFSRGDAVIAARLFAEVPSSGGGHSGTRLRSVLLARGVARAGYRYGMGQLVSAGNGGSPVEVVIPFFPAAWTLPAGCRLRLEVGDCESPLWIPPPRPDARSPDLAGLPVQNIVCIHHDNDHRSRLVY